MSQGLLLTLTEPPPAMAEEFNAWYDEEHLPERLAIPGFRSAQRWVLGTRYLATYELDSAAVLSSPPYLARYENPTPWSRRCLGKTLLFKRWACEQVEPGDSGPHPGARAIVFSHSPLDLRALQIRRFAAALGEPVFLYELAETSPGAYRRYEK